MMMVVVELLLLFVVVVVVVVVPLLLLLLLLSLLLLFHETDTTFSWLSLKNYLCCSLAQLPSFSNRNASVLGQGVLSDPESDWDLARGSGIAQKQQQ